jgi:hypothetical protein
MPKRTSLPTLRIPDAYADGLRKLASLSAEDCQSIATGLEKVPPRLRATALAKSIQDAVPGVAQTDLEKILETLSSFATAFGPQEEVTIDQFVTDLLEAMQSDAGRFHIPPKLGWDGFREQVTRLLASKTLRVSSRADDIQHEQTNLFTDARILSDIRTVFDAETVEPQAALIIHQMKLTYFHNGEYQDIYIAMDNADLRILHAAIERAERKTESLKTVISKTSLNYFESE